VVALGRLRGAPPAARFYLCSAPSSPCSRVAPGCGGVPAHVSAPDPRALAAQGSIRQLGERPLPADLQPPAERHASFEVRGDEWQIDARVPNAAPRARPASYRLSAGPPFGAYADTAHELSAPRTVYALSPEPGLDLGPSQRYNRLLPFADALYGSAATCRSRQDASYAVSVSAFGWWSPENSAARRRSATR